MNRIRKSISVKIVLIFTVLLIPMYALLFVSALTYIHSLETHVKQNTEAILKLNVAHLESEMNRIDRLFQDTSDNDRDYRQLLLWKGTDEDQISLYKVSEKLYEQNGVTFFSEAFFLYMPEEDQMLFSDRLIAPTQSIEFRAELKELPLIRHAVNWSIVEIKERNYLCHIIEDNGVYLGALIDMDEILRKITMDLPYAECRVSLRSFSEKSKPLMVSFEIGNIQERIYVALDHRSVDRIMPGIARAILVVGGITAVVLPVFLLLFFMRMIVRPIRQIERGIIRFGEGEQEYRIPKMNASGEFMSLRNSFNTMADEIQKLKIQQYEEQLEREQMALQNLLLQIRPHFLLNFFNQIFSMAELEDYEGIQKSSLYLSKFFRYLFRSERIATLKSELDLVEAYLELMNERFMDCFTVEWEIDKTLLSYRIPPLIVQNFVENIFKYAISDINLIHITLRLQKEHGWAVMTIEDDGPGIEEESLRQIREGRPIEKEDGTHIGIYNSLYRLKKLCGEDCRLDIESVLTEGTRVSIRLPLKEEDL